MPCQENNHPLRLGKLPSKIVLIARNLIFTFCCPDLYLDSNGKLQIMKIDEQVGASCFRITEFAFDLNRFIILEIEDKVRFLDKPTQETLLKLPIGRITQ